MSERLKRAFILPEEADFIPYVRDNTALPPIKTGRLSVDLLIGEERSALRAVPTGDATFVLRYKGREGALSSVSLPESDLSVVQLQGANQEGYRVNTGLVWVYFFADQLLRVAQHPESGVGRLTIPTFLAVQGFADATEKAMLRYEEFTKRVGMRYSAEEQVWARDIR